MSASIATPPAFRFLIPVTVIFTLFFSAPAFGFQDYIISKNQTAAPQAKAKSAVENAEEKKITELQLTGRFHLLKGETKAS